ncbi:hypothetical protein DFJ73DRAFT_760711 [Zopfochytrium polystomum]|nr:hypothetical protein DFJ73DRAFT_760711 [Zopfochytrium polystomum]
MPGFPSSLLALFAVILLVIATAGYSVRAAPKNLNGLPSSRVNKEPVRVTAALPSKGGGASPYETLFGFFVFFLSVVLPEAAAAPYDAARVRMLYIFNYWKSKYWRHKNLGPAGSSSPADYEYIIACRWDVSKRAAKIGTMRRTLPDHAVEIICHHLDPMDAIRLSTLIRLRPIQAQSYCALFSRPFAEASERGHVDLLDLLLQHTRASGAPITDVFQALSSASDCGHVAALQWWKESGVDLSIPDFEDGYYYPLPMDDASANGHVHVLQWWKDSGIELDGFYSRLALELASEKGRVDVLQWWRDSGLDLSKPVPFGAFGSEEEELLPLDGASGRGHVHVLQWWKESGLALEYTDKAMDDASKKGHVAVLDWWRECKYEPKFSNRAIDQASKKGHIAVLEWWKDSGLELKYSHKAMDDAAGAGSLDVLRWWKSSGLELKYTHAMDLASGNGHVKVLEWWLLNGLEPIYCAEAMDDASAHGHISVLQWWEASSLELKYSERAMDEASVYSHLDVLDWWNNSGHSLRYSNWAIDGARELAVLEWWQASDLDLQYSHEAMDTASKEGTLVILQWWSQSGLKLKYTSAVMDEPTIAGNADTLQWWKDNGLTLKYSARGLDDACRLRTIFKILPWWKASGLMIEYSQNAFTNSDMEVLQFMKANGLHPKTAFQIPPRFYNRPELQERRKFLEDWIAEIF